MDYSQQQQQQQNPQYHQQAAYAQSYATYHHQNQHLYPSQYHQQQYGASAYPRNHYHQYHYPGQDSSSAYYQAGPAPPEIAGVGPVNPSQIHGHVSHLSQVADRNWHANVGPPQMGHGRSSNRGGGRMGGVSFWDGGWGRGNFNHQPSRQDGGEPSSFCDGGRGRGWGLTERSRGRKSYQSGEQSLAPESAQQAPPASVLQRRPVLPVAWCDICRVDCNSLVILEQHKCGKRHKKTVGRVDEIQKQQRLFDKMQAEVMPEMAVQSTEPDPALQTKEVYQSSSVMGITPNTAGLSAQLGDATKVSIAQEIMPSAVFSAVRVDGTKTAELTLKQDFEIEAQKGHTAEGHPMIVMEEMATEASPSDAQLAEGSLTEGHQGNPKVDAYDRFDSCRGGLKRQMTSFELGGKRLKTSESADGRVPELPRDQPIVCTLCNKMYDTLADFECHLSDKKHVSKIGRFQVQGSVYGPLTLYIPPNQPKIYPTEGPEPLFYGLKCREMLQQEASGDLNGSQVGNYGLGHYLSERTRGAEVVGPNSQAMEILDYPEGEFVAAKRVQGRSNLG